MFTMNSVLDVLGCCGIPKERRQKPATTKPAPAQSNTAGKRSVAEDSAEKSKQKPKQEAVKPKKKDVARAAENVPVVAQASTMELELADAMKPDVGADNKAVREEVVESMEISEDVIQASSSVISKSSTEITSTGTSGLWSVSQDTTDTRLTKPTPEPVKMTEKTQAKPVLSENVPVVAQASAMEQDLAESMKVTHQADNKVTTLETGSAATMQLPEEGVTVTQTSDVSSGRTMSAPPPKQIQAKKSQPRSTKKAVREEVVESMDISEDVVQASSSVISKSSPEITSPSTSGVWSVSQDTTDSRLTKPTPEPVKMTKKTEAKTVRSENVPVGAQPSAMEQDLAESMKVTHQADNKVTTLETGSAATMQMQEEEITVTQTSDVSSGRTMSAPPPKQSPTRESPPKSAQKSAVAQKVTEPIEIIEDVVQTSSTTVTQSAPPTGSSPGPTRKSPPKSAQKSAVAQKVTEPIEIIEDVVQTSSTTVTQSAPPTSSSPPTGSSPPTSSSPVEQLAVKPKQISTEQHGTVQLEQIEESRGGLDDSASGSSGSVEYSRHQVTETEELIETEVEETVTMVITGVVTNPGQDPENILPLQEAISRGILDFQAGTFINMSTRQKCSMVEAMNNGWIKMGQKKVATTEERVKSLGIVTIRTTRETMPYTVKNAMDKKSGKMIPVEEALSRGILDSVNGTFTNTSTGARMLIGDAVDQQLVEIQYDMDASGTVHEEVLQTYSVHAVIDQQARKKLAFHEAVSRGIIDKDTGEYVNNLTNERFSAEDALKKGFIKATLTDKPEDISLDKIGNQTAQRGAAAIRKKLLNPLKALRRLKK